MSDGSALLSAGTDRDREGTTPGLPGHRQRRRPRQPGRFMPGPTSKERSVIKQAPVKGSDKVKVSFVIPSNGIAGKLSVVGDFNGSDPASHPLRKRANGTRSV